MYHPTDRITHTTTFVTPVVEHWLKREIAPQSQNIQVFVTTSRNRHYGGGGYLYNELPLPGSFLVDVLDFVLVEHVDALEHCHQMVGRRHWRHVADGAEHVQHLHVIKDVLTTGRSNHKQFPFLKKGKKEKFYLTTRSTSPCH